MNEYSLAKVQYNNRSHVLIICYLLHQKGYWFFRKYPYIHLLYQGWLSVAMMLLLHLMSVQPYLLYLFHETVLQQSP